MTQLCNNCRAAVPEESLSCPVCGEELDPFRTILPPKFPQAAPARPPLRPRDPDSPVPGPPPPPQAPAPAPARDQEEPAPPRPARPAPPPKRPAPPPPPPRPRRPPSQTAPPPAPVPQPQTPAPPPQPQAPAPPPYHYPPAALPPQPGGGLRGLFSRLMGSAPGYPQPAAPPPGYPYAPPPGYPYAPPPYPAPAAPPEPSTPVPPPAPSSQGPVVPTPDLDEDDDGRTVAMGAHIKNLKIPSSLLALEIRDHQGQWHFWTHLGASGMKVGRSDKSARFPELNSMAARHMRVGVEGSRVIVEDLGSLNGVFLKIRQPVEIQDGARFRVGSQVVEFRRVEPAPPVEPLVSEDGEVFWSGDLQAPACLQFLRPDGQPGLRVPLTKPGATVLGRESRSGRPVDVALAGDEMASGQHAAIRREGDRFFLEDLKSRNGTFLMLRETAEVQIGDELLVGRVLLRVSDALKSQ